MSLIKSRIRFKSLSLAEMLFSMALIAAFLVASAPLISIRDKIQGQDLSSIMCIKNELAANPSEDISASACALAPDNPCCKAVKSCKYDQNNACPTLTYYADYGNPTEQLNGKKSLGTVCDQGGIEGCRYFATSCNRDNTTCDNSTNNYSLKYYINLPENSTSQSKVPITNIVRTLYSEGSPNILYWVNSTNSCPVTNMAYYIRGASCPVGPFQMELHNTIGNYWDGANVIQVNKNTGDIYLTGKSGDSSSIYQAFVIKMNSSGNILPPYGFQKYIQSSYPSYKYTVGMGLGIDSSNNVYVALNTAINSSTAYGVGVIRMNSSGNMTSPNGWVQLLKEASYSASPGGLRVDSNDNIYINTYDLNDAANMMDGSIIRMNSSGTITLQKRVNSSNNSYDCFYDKPEVDGAGNMYVTGYSYNGSNYDILALKMNSGGNITSPNGWQERINSSDNQTDYGMRLALDPINGFLYVAALSSNGNNNDLGILELDATTGTVLLNKRINSISNFDDGPYGITVDNNGYVYIAGYSYVDSSNSNILIFKMSPAGVLTAPNGWQMRIVGTSATLTNQMGSYISAGDDGYIYVCGIMKDSAGSHVDTFVMKMNRTQTSNDTIFTNVSSPFTGVSSPFTVTTANYAASNPFTAYSDGNYTILNPGLSFN